MRLANIYHFLKSDLKEVEDKLSVTVAANHPILQEASLQLLKAGGKRIRPVFVLLAAQFGNYEKNKEQIMNVAVAIELIHMATLVHDDVVDDSELRRGKPTIKHLYGNRVAMYAGDYILARALELITEVKEPTIHHLLSKTLVKVVEGEMTQLEDKYRLQQHMKDYLRRIKRKTALLIAASCKLGAIASGATMKDANNLYRYGLNIGMSFQIIDDILDFTASPKQLGKPTGSDLLQGHITLPVLYAIADPTVERQIIELFAHKDEREDRIDDILRALRKTDAIERSYALSNQYLQKSITALHNLPENKAYETLETIAQVIGNRRS